MGILLLEIMNFSCVDFFVSVGYILVNILHLTSALCKDIAKYVKMGIKLEMTELFLHITHVICCSIG